MPAKKQVSFSCNCPCMPSHGEQSFNLICLRIMGNFLPIHLPRQCSLYHVAVPHSISKESIIHFYFLCHFMGPAHRRSFEATSLLLSRSVPLSMTKYCLPLWCSRASAIIGYPDPCCYCNVFFIGGAGRPTRWRLSRARR